MTDLTNGDFNCDGLRDLIVFGRSNPVYLIMRNDSGWDRGVELFTNTHLTDVEAMATDALTGAVGDFNGDGAHDLVTATVLSAPDGERRGHLAIFVGDGTGSFSDAQYLDSGGEYQWGFVTAGDLNADGLDDFISLMAIDGSDVTSEFSVWMASR